MRKTVPSLIALTVAALALTGCSVADPNPSEIGLKYNGGSFSNQQFLACIAPP
jgi:hypothetical protein